MNVPSDIRPAAATSRRRPRAWIAMLTAVVAVAAALSAFTVVTDDQPASAATASGFDPGNIISDANFYNANALTAAQVQYFLDQKVPTCRSGSGPACLRNYTQNTRAIGAVAGRCSAIGGGTMTGAQIIDGVARACNISQKVLLVLLEKEQGLITSSAPSSYKYTPRHGLRLPGHGTVRPGLQRLLRPGLRGRPAVPALQGIAELVGLPGGAHEHDPLQPERVVRHEAGLHPEPGHRRAVHLHAVRAEPGRDEQPLRHR